MKTGKSKINIIVVLALLAALLITSVVSAVPKDGPTVKISVDQNFYDSNQNVLVTVVIENTTKHSVRILKWFTPAYGVEEPLFAVRRNGEPVAYTGAIYKRPAITGEDYITLKAGESVTSVVNLDDYYDMSGTGQYDVMYAVASYNLHSEKGNAFKYRDFMVSEKIDFKAEGRSAKGGKPTPVPTPPPGGTTFNACTIDQQALLNTARNDAKTYASNAENYLLGNNQGPRYITWFGVYSSTRYDTVKTHFTAISDAWDNAGVTFDCGCKQNYYAYVYPNQPYKIYICKVFWQAPATGTDSKAGTLIHEMSHFDVVAGTDDVVYGTNAAQNLAISNPSDAIRNADNHEYFAENTQSQP